MNILTIEEVRKAIYQDVDFDAEELQRLSAVASSFLLEKTNYDFSQDDVIEPLAKQCAIAYIRQQYFSAKGYVKEFDLSFGITGMLIDLQNIAKEKELEV